MKRPALALLIVALPSLVHAQGPTDAPPPAPAAPTPAPPAPVPAPPATSAVAVIDRANAAYEYGDMKEVVAASRSIVDGEVESSPAERTQALRLLGIGLYLTGRPTGAEAAFLELLRSRPKMRLDPTTTRPEVVAFFEDVRRRHRDEIEAAVRARPHRSAIWNFLPPVGQFKNGDYGRGGLILGLEVTAGAAALTTDLLLRSWQGPYHNFPGHEGSAHPVRTWNQISCGVLAATYVAGVIDAFVRSDREPEEVERPVSFFLFPGGAGLSGRF
jgi:hypothetical protein